MNRLGNVFKRPAIFSVGVLLVSALLVGCVQTDLESLKSLLEKKRAEAAPPASVNSTEPVFAAANFSLKGDDPFDPQRLIRTLQNTSKKADAKYELENKRPQQFLEKFTLESFSFVGSLKRQGRHVALVRVENAVHSIALGAYMGSNMGKVIRITDEEMQLRELVQDNLGQWGERIQILKLQVKAQ